MVQSPISKNCTTRNRTSGAETVQFYPRQIQKIESLLAERELWMAVGEVAMVRYRKLQPPRRVSLGMAVRLVDLASKLGRVAVGLELRPIPADRHPTEAFPSWNLSVTEALRRAYGDLVESRLSTLDPHESRKKMAGTDHSGLGHRTGVRHSVEGTMELNTWQGGTPFA